MNASHKMSNSLHIALTQAQVRGSDQVLYGYTALDDNNATHSIYATSWDGFKSEYPTLQALLDQILGESVFEGMTPEYEIVGENVVVTPDDHDVYSSKFSHITLAGFTGFY